MQMLGQDDISWAGMKRFLGTSGVIQQILGFNARQVTNSMKNKVMKIVNQHPSSFEQETIKRASQATAPLAQWCIANIKFYLPLSVAVAHNGVAALLLLSLVTLLHQCLPVKK